MKCLRFVLTPVSVAAILLEVTFATPLESPAELAHPQPPLEKASWIWGDKNQAVVQLRTTLTLDKAPTAASVLITADNGYELFINGAVVGFDVGGGGEIWGSVERYDITSHLTRGRNNIGIRGTMLGGSCGLVAAARIDTEGQAARELVTDASWRVASAGTPDEYSHPEYVEDSSWTGATVLGPMGMAPWGTLAASDSKGGRRPANLSGAIPLTEPDGDFRWPQGIAFIGDDCSVYKPLRSDAWGVCFRVGEWSRAYTEFDLPCPSKIGRKLYSLKPVRPGAEQRLLFDAGSGAIGSPSVSYDGKSIYVAMANEGESFFHIYRIPSEGGPPQRLSDGPFHDIDPAELPDGRIVFTSTRIGSFEEYHSPPSRALFVMNSDGSDIQPLTFTPIFDNEPKVLADGRIAFIRTDNFFDRAKVETRIHVIHPDGTRGDSGFGADQGADYGVRLRKFGYGSPSPMPDGRLACISNRGNFIGNPGGAEPTYHNLPGGLGDLSPLPDGRLLCTVLRPEGIRMISDVLAVIDPQDNGVVSIHESPSGPVHSPVFLGARPRPPVLTTTVDPEKANQPGATGFLFCQNVRATRKSKAGWDQVRAIRVLAAKALTTRSSHSHIVHAGHETVELGTVPVAPDGSFYAEVPADTPISLQAVDAEGRSELNEMSWIYVRPGERRSCVGCHQSQSTAPMHNRGAMAMAMPPLKLLGQGQAYRYRGNNSGVTGMMDLQFERFRETASLNRHAIGDDPLATGRQEVEQLIGQLRGDDAGRKISAAQRLAIFHDRRAAAALAETLRDENREVRVAAAMALAACGTRDSVPALLNALRDSDEIVATAADVALGNLVDHRVAFSAYGNADDLRPTDSPWHAWFNQHGWDAIEKSLVARLQEHPASNARRTVVALGHVGGDAARKALREFVAREKDDNPYPPFVKDNRTDRFTFGGSSPLNPRTLQESVRALGYLQDTSAVGLLSGILADNIEPETANLFLAEAAIDALGWIGTAEAETILINTFGKLKNYWEYVGWYSDHPALYACHNSPLHARIIEALDALGSTRTAGIVPYLIRSVPTDPDRALFPQNDDYEILVGRIIRRSGRGEEAIETCLSLLGDTGAKVSDDLEEAISTTLSAWAGKPDPDNRAAQILSLVCRDQKYEPRVRHVYDSYRARPEDPIARPLGNPDWIPQRHWVLFYLGRSLGNLADPRSVDTLLASLKSELNEARHGYPDPSEPNIHFLHLEYTPCWRASAAWALGGIGDRRAAPTLLRVVANLNNATDVRHAAAVALGKLGDTGSLEQLKELVRDYPEYSTRLALQRACAKTQENIKTTE